MAPSGTHTEQKQQTPQKEVFNVVPWIIGAVLLLGLAVLAGIYRSRTMTIQNVRFDGYYFVTLRELEQQIDIPEGIDPDSLDYSGIIRSTEKIPYVKYAEVSVDPGGNLLIHITERQPIAMLADGDQKIYVDADGVKLPLVLGKAVNVPILYGFPAEPMEDILNGDAFKAVRNFLVAMNHHPVSDATISEVAWTEDEGVIALTNDSGVKLVFGKDDFKPRLRNWEAFYAEVIRKKGMQVMQSVDLRFKGQIVTRES